MATKKSRLPDSKAMRAVADAARKPDQPFRMTPTFDFQVMPVDPKAKDEENRVPKFRMERQMRASRLPDGTRVAHKRQGVRIPATLLASLDAMVDKNKLASIVALADWALQYIERNNLIITATVNEYTGIAAPTRTQPAPLKPKPKAVKKATAKKAVKKVAAKRKK